MAFDFNSFTNNTSIANQTTGSFSSGIKNITSTVSSGVSGAINSITSKLGLSGLSASGSLAGSYNTQGSTNVVAELKDTMGVAVPIGAALPEMVINQSGPPTTMTYPEDLGKYYIQFSFFDKYQDNPIKRLTKRNSFMLTLPIPENLQEVFGMDYSAKELGAFGVLDATGAIDSDNLGILLNGSVGQAEKMSEGIGSKVAGALTTGGGGSASLYAARTLAKPLGADNVSNLLDRATGTILNPYQALQFQGVNLREHTFSYTFSPNSESEAERLKQIIKELKIRMHPTLNGLLMNFPDQCKIKLSGGLNDIAYYTFQDCYLKTMSVNYAPSGSVAFFKKGIHPVEIKVDLTFGEVRPLTRNFYTGETNGITTEASPLSSTSPYGTTEAATPTPSLLRSK